MGNCLSSCAKSSSEALQNNEGKSQQLISTKANTVIIAQQPTCSPIKIFATSANNDNEIRVLVQKELAALQAQIKHSQAVLESLGAASQGNGKKVCAFIHRTTQTLGQENQPRSLECIVTKDNKSAKDWKSQELASSCPAIVTNVSIAVQTDNNRQVGLTVVDVRVDSDVGQEQDCFLPPISSYDSVNTHQSRSSHKSSSSSTVGYEPRSLDLDLDIYRSCRKLSVLPEEEVCEAPPSPHLMLLGGTQQAHSFESYLHPHTNSGLTGPVRQLSDPTPANTTSPPPRVSTRRPLQIQTPHTQYFRFPDTNSFETDSGLESKPTRSGSRSSPTCDIDERITSPTYGILQDTVSQLVTFSPIVQNLEVPHFTFINSPETSPYKTPPEGFSNIQTPEYCSTPHSEISNDLRKKSIESVSESLSFQTLSDSSPGNVNNPSSSPFGSLSPVKRSSLEDGGTLVTDFNNPNPSKLVVKPLHSMLSILMDPKPKAKPEMTESLNRAPSRRRLTRSLMRVSSQTPLELVSVREPLPVQPDSTSSSVETVIRATDLHEKPIFQRKSISNIDSLEDSASFETMQNDSVPEISEPANLNRSLSETSAASSNISSQSFPSLSDNVLRQLGLWLEEKQAVICDPEPQSEKDIEDKYTSLLLAFQTDKLTLNSRLELQNRLRDQAEHNLNIEIQQLQVAVTNLISSRSTELSDLHNQINTLTKAAMRVSSAAEMYGAVQQESRLSRAVDIILSHVENLKQAYNKEKTEHVETKKVLSENKSIPNLPAVQKARCRRRATIAVGVAQLGTNVTSHDNNSAINSASLVDARAGSFFVRSRFQRQPQLSRERSNSVDNFQGLDKQICAPTEEESQQIPILLRMNPNEKKLIRTCSHKACTCDQPSESDVGEESDVSIPAEPSLSPCVVSSYHRLLDHWNNILSSTDDLVLHARYGLAGILIVAAIAIFCSMLYL
ncbi:uncharacterized protein LOC111044961 isoform X2 [Nilaparvata lugens]|uniref:uncharacterized protein LOC111044961 isoform X2 n=1 Tax=Nilaparvata lugens TaxID=108931 RepID=UPI00193CB586|nr:uncharacterized protein LOC111044961 isoform X2 [Nilaparvata lugens]